MNNQSVTDLNLTSFKSLIYFEWDKHDKSKWIICEYVSESVNLVTALVDWFTSVFDSKRTVFWQYAT